MKPAGPRRVVPAVALAAAVVGAGALMTSPLTPWTTPVAVGGLVLAALGVTVLVRWLLRTW